MQVVLDGHTGRSRGFAFIYYESQDDATEARNAMNGADMDGRKIRVDYSITKRPHTPTPGTFSYFLWLLLLIYHIKACTWDDQPTEVDKEEVEEEEEETEEEEVAGVLVHTIVADPGLQPTEEEAPLPTTDAEITAAAAEATHQEEENIPPEDTKSRKQVEWNIVFPVRY